MRRRFMGAVLWQSALVLCLMAMPALAQSFEASIVAQLRKQGYVQITQTKTLLGRIKILARQNDGWREIVINPRTGEVLRDVWTVDGKAASPRIGTPAGSASSGHGGSGGGGWDDSDNAGIDDGHGEGSNQGEDGGHDDDGGDDGDDSGDDDGDDSGDDHDDGGNDD